MHYLPIFADLNDRPCLVIGGGDVAMDAARSALRAAAYEEARLASDYEDADARSSMTEAIDVARS